MWAGRTARVLPASVPLAGRNSASYCAQASTLRLGGGGGGVVGGVRVAGGVRGPFVASHGRPMRAVFFAPANTLGRAYFGSGNSRKTKQGRKKKRRSHKPTGKAAAVESAQQETGNLDGAGGVGEGGASASSGAPETAGAVQPGGREVDGELLFEAPHQSMQFMGMSAVSIIQFIAMSVTADTLFWYSQWSDTSKVALVYTCLGGSFAVAAAMSVFRKSYVGRLELLTDPATRKPKDVMVTHYSFGGALSKYTSFALADIHSVKDTRHTGGRYITFKVKGKTGRYLLDIPNGEIPDALSFEMFLTNVKN